MGQIFIVTGHKTNRVNHSYVLMLPVYGLFNHPQQNNLYESKNL